jgi:hypothetical protein
MMGLPAGWISEPMAGKPKAANKIAGNGVVPAQAADGIRRMLQRAGWSGFPIE